MAGDWIKFETATPDKPEVWEIAGALDIDPDAVVGKLLRVWSWFDQHTEEGNAASVTMSLLDRSVGVIGFCAAMIDAGWMVQEGNRINLPNFDRHNGKTAKNRALTAKRVAKHKRSGNAKGNDEVTPDELPKEEKRREEVKPINTSPSGDGIEEPPPRKPKPTARAKSQPSDAELSDAFEVYWAAGMRKIDKKKARKSFDAIIKRENYEPGAFSRQLYDDVQARLRANVFGFKQLHPTTYLNGERWNDEIVNGNIGGGSLGPLERFEQAMRERDEREASSGMGMAEDDRAIRDDMDTGAGGGGTYDLGTGTWDS